MTDDRFHPRRGPFSLGELVEHANAVLACAEGASLVMTGVAPLETAGPGDISIYCDSRHAAAFAQSSAGAIVTSAKLGATPHEKSSLIIARDPRAAFAAIGLKFYPRAVELPGIDDGALIHPTAELGRDCRIDSGAVIGPMVQIGAGSHLSLIHI